MHKPGHEEADETATYVVTTTRPAYGRTSTDTHTHRNVHAIKWDERFMRVHGTDSPLPQAMYAHAAIIDVQLLDPVKDEHDRLLHLGLTPDALRKVADLMDGDDFPRKSAEPLAVARMAEHVAQAEQ